ncbi:MAG: hypothetical protein GY856_42815 [bacterium]|nr:hypothetical protein [bacterium]
MAEEALAIMRTYHFELVLGAPTTDEENERLFDRFEGRISSAVVNGTPLLYLHLDAPSMDHAIREAIQGARELDLSIKRIELDPDAFFADAA